MDKTRRKKPYKLINKNKKLQFHTKKPNIGEIENKEIEELKQKYELIEPKKIEKFIDFPLSRKTLNGLRDSNYKIPTEIQKEAIGYALQGKDILGAAITGSGKTLAFLIPVLETLYLKKWSRMDGLGSLIISPTRELAYQIFETLKKIGAHHDFSAALIIGGKNLKFERRRMDQVNIIICTPGRLLQHMDENPLFDSNTLQILVLDEADRILDMGFEKTMNAIIENFPPERQTLLFSATQTKSVRDLARLSLNSPVYVAPTTQSALITPETLKQSYVVIELEEKITMLWSFIKNHLKQKVIVFMSSCKQVKFITEMFTKLRSGTPILGLYGTLHQDRRVAIYNEFVRKSNAVLVCTDIASRGLDFPTVNWVIQLDCPEDATAYIHRAGRTARNNAKGECLLVLLPSEEEAMIEELKERKVTINKIFIDPKRMFSPRVKIEGNLAQNSELKATAQRAFVSYIKSVFLMKNKNIFKVNALNVDAYAQSLGLVVTPRVKFLERWKKPTQQVQQNHDDEDNEDEEDVESEQEHQNKSGFNFNMSDDSDDDDLLTVKKRHVIEDGSDVDKKYGSDDEKEEIKNDLELNLSRKSLKPVTKAAIAKKFIKKNIFANKIVMFDDDGKQVTDPTRTLQSEAAKKLLEEDDEEDLGGINIEKAKLILREEDQYDKLRFRERAKIKRREMKQKLKKQENDDESVEQDDFGSDEGSDGEGPDLSWLPDPDKVFKPKSKRDRDNSHSDNSSSETSDGQKKSFNSDQDNDSEEENQIFHRPPKKLYERKTKKHKLGAEDEDDKIKNPPPKKKKKYVPDNLTVNEAEMIAMKLLNGIA